MTTGRPPRPRLTLPPSRRLSRDRDYQAVFDCGLRKSLGPLTLFARPNGLAHPRLGLSVSRRVGIAVRRNAIKRRLREAFRHVQHDLPRAADGNSYDLILSVRAHDPLPAPEYRRVLLTLAERAHREVERRARRSEDGGGA
ncbi:MAG: ribonuclease P protein component [Leptolyngbya sp. PLA2]|nr:ribonuclease P protein component [Leptolyngbya sp.]MCE7971950.1 ribonuclease P protein component [Leptolyngbya sp. PL-A2]MCQ3939686.1 ribonuclease P protein component [cyanobacterium CYA1]MCZ7632068.1 ribonuclease P protein component [Phycisphaerales bacterium]MDL1903943.1 ribonuclease P protein component [Synechococcales cyanobacterium CNB]GIK18706.1 MAG: hypothetical protein BroJett004_08700 [Planctomycetota bacterium]